MQAVTMFLLLFVDEAFSDKTKLGGENHAGIEPSKTYAFKLLGNSYEIRDRLLSSKCYAPLKYT